MTDPIQSFKGKHGRGGRRKRKARRVRQAPEPKVSAAIKALRGLLTHSTLDWAYSKAAGE